MAKLLVTSNFSFSHSVFKRLVLQTRKIQGLFGKVLNMFVTCGRAKHDFCSYSIFYSIRFLWLNLFAYYLCMPKQIHIKYVVTINKRDRSKGNSCESDKLFSLPIINLSQIHKMLDQNEMQYFVDFEDLFSFCIFGFHKLTPLKEKNFPFQQSKL